MNRNNNDPDKILRDALGSPRPLDVESFTERTMHRLREERARRGILARLFPVGRPLRWAMPAMGLAGAAIILVALTLLMTQPAGDDPGAYQFAAATLTPTPVLVAAATPGSQSMVNYGPPVPNPREAALLADTSPETILLEGAMAAFAQNDPTLRPHSVWDQTR